jgi:hypothetical protein
MTISPSSMRGSKASSGIYGTATRFERCRRSKGCSSSLRATRRSEQPAPSWPNRYGSFTATSRRTRRLSQLWRALLLREAIATGFVESTVNQVISKRMVKKQQMRWTKKGAHLLLQVQTQVLNDGLHKTFERWYPTMTKTDVPLQQAACPRFVMVSIHDHPATKHLHQSPLPVPQVRPVVFPAWSSALLVVTTLMDSAAPPQAVELQGLVLRCQPHLHYSDRADLGNSNHHLPVSSARLDRSTAPDCSVHRHIRGGCMGWYHRSRQFVSGML